MSLEERAAICAQQLRDAAKGIGSMIDHIMTLRKIYPGIPPQIDRDERWQNAWEYLYSRSYGRAFQNLIRFLCHHNLIGDTNGEEVFRGEGYFDNSLVTLRRSLGFI
jgi:hypothetical protein